MVLETDKNRVLVEEREVRFRRIFWCVFDYGRQLGFQSGAVRRDCSGSWDEGRL